MWRRLFLYIGIMLFRGFILYQGMNQLEDWFTTENPSDCWYQDWLRPNQSTCYGRRFDFSDHIVLYFAQLVPIGLLETLDILFSKTSRSNAAVMRRQSSADSEDDVENFTHHHASHSKSPQHKRTALIVASLVYLYGITLWSAHRTAAYFHTAGEVVVGYGVSLMIQLPLYYLLTPRSRPLRKWFFGSA